MRIKRIKEVKTTFSLISKSCGIIERGSVKVCIKKGNGINKAVSFYCS